MYWLLTVLVWCRLRSEVLRFLVTSIAGAASFKEAFILGIEAGFFGIIIQCRDGGFDFAAFFKDQLFSAMPFLYFSSTLY